jgi:hypothetical protein
MKFAADRPFADPDMTALARDDASLSLSRLPS